MGTAVRTKIDIVFTKNGESSALQLFQFPFTAANGLERGQVAIRNKQKLNRYEFDINLETDNPNYSKSRASSFTHALSDQQVEKSMKRTRYVSKKIDDKNQFCVGVFRNGKLFLTPVTSVVQLVPSYDHIDYIDKARRRKEKEAAAGQKLDESSSQDESTDKTSARKAQAITVKFGKNESEESKAKRKQTYPYLKEMWEEEPWSNLTFLNFSSGSDVVSKLFKPPETTSSGKELIKCGRKEYLNILLPPEVKSSEKNCAEPYAPSSVLKVENLKHMSILNKIIAILKNAYVVKYSQLITLLGNKAEKDNVIGCLKKAAVLVRGCWVINSETLYPEKSVSSACGISAELMQRGRNYILWRMNKIGYVMRKEMCSHTKLPGEEVRGILEAISQLNSDTGWEFLYPVDTYFLESNRALKEEYNNFWFDTGKALCAELGLNFKPDHSPRRHGGRTRNVSTDSSGTGSPSPGSEKRRRRRSSSRNSISARDENTLLDKLGGGDAYRRTHSSPSESSALGEKFLSEDEMKALQNRMSNFLLVKVSDFRAVVAHITGRSLLPSDYSRAARDMDLFEVPIKTELSRSSVTMAYCVRPVEFSDDERLFLARCAAVFSSKGFITKQSVPKLIENINVDKTTVEKVLKQLCWLKDKKWVPRFLGVDILMVLCMDANSNLCKQEDLQDEVQVNTLDATPISSDLNDKQLPAEDKSDHLIDGAQVMEERKTADKTVLENKPLSSKTVSSNDNDIPSPNEQVSTPNGEAPSDSVTPAASEKTNPTANTRSSVSRRSVKSITPASGKGTSDEIKPPSNVAPSPIRGVALNKTARRTASIVPTYYQDLHIYGKYSAAPDKSPSGSEKSDDQCYQTRLPTIIARNKDFYCWVCHSSGSGKDEEGTTTTTEDDRTLLPCNNCFRVYHKKCVETYSDSTFSIDTSEPNWECFECKELRNSETSSRCATWLSVENLGMCLQRVVSRLVCTPSFDLFVNKVSKDEYPDYSKYIYKSISLSELDKKALTLQYSCGEGLRQDCKLFLHNSAIFNGPTSPITNTARRLLNNCEKELAQVEACPDCYCNSLLRDDFFESPCRIPHPLVWAKYKNYPYWPSKIFQMKPPSSVDVRFFGEHDRAIVNINQVFYYSKNPPEPVMKFVKKFEDAQKEVQLYIKKLQMYQPYSLATDKKAFKMLSFGDAFGPIDIKIEEDIRLENDKSPSVSPDLMKQIEESTSGVGTASSSSANSSRKSQGKSKSNSKGDDEIMSDVDLSSDSSDESDNETLGSSFTFKLLGKNSKTKSKDVSSRSKRGLSIGSKQQEESDSQTSKLSEQVPPPTKKSRRDSSTSSATSVTSRLSELPKTEISKSKSEQVKESVPPSSKEEKTSKAKKPDAPSFTPKTAYNKTRSRRNDEHTESSNHSSLDSVQIKSEKNATVDSDKSKEDLRLVTPKDEQKIETETVENCTKTEPEVVHAASSVFQSIEAALEAEDEKKDAVTNEVDMCLDKTQDKMEVDAPNMTESSTVESPDNESRSTESDKEKAEEVESSCSSEMSIGDKVVQKQTYARNEKLIKEPVKEITSEEVPSDTKMSTDADNKNSQSPTTKTASQPIPSEEPHVAATAVSKKVSPDTFQSEMEETGRGKRMKFKNTSLYCSDEETEVKMFSKSANSKRPKEPKESTSFSSSQSTGSLAATLHAKRQAIQSPRNDSRPTSPLNQLGSKHPSKSSTHQHHGNTSLTVKPVILSESSYKSKPKGVVKGTPQPTPPKQAPGPSSEEALLNKLQERLSSQIGDLLNQVMQAQIRGESISSEDIMKAIMINGRSQLSAPKLGSSVSNSSPFQPQLGSAFRSPPPKKVETRDSPAQVDIPDEMAATQRAELRKVVAEKQKVLEDRQRLVDEIGSWQRKVKSMKEADNERREHLLSKSRQEFAAKIEELRREKNVQLNDLTRHYELLVAEVEMTLTSLHKEEVKKLKEEKATDLKEIKRKQWCAYCLKESQYHCCWNTSYCDYKCQQKHWGEHMKTCSQKNRSTSKKPHSGSTSGTGTPDVNKMVRPSPMASPSPALSAAGSSTSSTLPPTASVAPSQFAPISNLASVPPPSSMTVQAQAHQMQQQQHQQISAIGSAVPPPGAHIVTLPPGTMPPPGSVPMMSFNTGPQQLQQGNPNTPQLATQFSAPSSAGVPFLN